MQRVQNFECERIMRGVQLTQNHGGKWNFISMEHKNVIKLKIKNYDHSK